MGPQAVSEDVVDLYEQLLYQRASRGIRPVLYVSTDRDLECSVLMLIENDNGGREWGRQQQVPKPIGYRDVRG